MVTRIQINQAVEKGIAWLKSQQNENGTYGKWNPGSTALAVLALLGSNVAGTDPAIANAITGLLKSQYSDSTFFRSLTVMALVANGDKTPDILRRVQTDVEWLNKAQGSDPGDLLSFGGWGHAAKPALADGSNTHFALLALYSAAGWDLDVPRETWSRALAWYRRNHDVNNDGSCFYDLNKRMPNAKKETLYSMTSAVLASMKIINKFFSDPDLKTEAQYLFDRAWHWLDSNYNISLSQDASDSWRYFYLYSLKTGCAMEPSHSYMANRDWYTDIADYLVRRQEADGGWSSRGEKESTRIIYTSFALMALSGDVITSASTDHTHTVARKLEMPAQSHYQPEKANKEHSFNGENQQIDCCHKKLDSGYGQQDMGVNKEYIFNEGDLPYTGGENQYGAGEDSDPKEERYDPQSYMPVQPVEKDGEIEKNETRYLVIKQNPDGKWEIYVENQPTGSGQRNYGPTTPFSPVTAAPEYTPADDVEKEYVEEGNYMEPSFKHDVIHITVNAGDSPKESDNLVKEEEKDSAAVKSPLQSFVEQLWQDNTGDKNPGEPGYVKKEPWYTQLITNWMVDNTAKSESESGQTDAAIESMETKDTNSGMENQPVHPLDEFLNKLWGPKK